MKPPSKYIIAVLSILAFYYCYPQQLNNANMIPNLAPTTPDASQLGRFGNYPVSHFTGLSNISIPLYEVKVGEIQLPISISYHTSGIKVTDRSGWVGLGWALSAGGSISRTVMGMPDEGTTGYFSGNTIKQPAEFNTSTEAGLLYLEDISKARLDTEPDIYSYSIGGHSGKFLYNQASNFIRVTVPYDPIKIIRQYTPNNLSFDALDLNGNQYQFNILEKSSGMNDNLSTTSAWLPSSIVSSDRQDTVKFTYSMSAGITYSDIIDKITVTDLVNNPIDAALYESNYGTWTTANVATFSEEQKLTEIKYPNGKVTFVLGEREDGWTGGFGTQKRLDQIQIYGIVPGTINYQLIKSIKFYHGYFVSTDGTQTKRLRLDSLHVLDNSGAVIERYSFDYNTAIALPEYKSRKRDFWGYFNNRANVSLVPRMTIPWQSNLSTQVINIEIANTNPTDGREPDPNYMQAGILQKITYPTGGWTEFDYETNQYLDAQSNLKYAGGLRVAQMRSYDGISPIPIKQTIKYGENESGIGRANFLLNNYFFQNILTDRTIHWHLGLCNWDMGSARYRTYISQPNLSIEPYDGSPVVYPTVTVYEGDGVNNIGKTIYQYSDTPDQPNSGSFQVGVPAVYSNHYKRGLLLNEGEYRNNGSSYSLVRSVSNSYGAFSDSSKVAMGFKVIKSIITNSAGVFNDQDVRCGPDGNPNICGPNDSYSYQYAYYNVYTGDNKLISTSETVYDLLDNTRYQTTTSTFTYSNFQHQQITQQTSINSLGKQELKTIKYPHESTGTVYNEMIQKHLIAYPVEETILEDAVLKERITRNFQKYFNDVYQPATIYRQIASGSNELEVTFLGYDNNGNVLGTLAKDNIPTSYVWGYNKRLPIAIVKGATSDQIAYTSFEEDSNQGNWTYSGTSSSGKTGQKSHLLQGSPISKSGLNSTKQYIVSFWATGTPTVSNVIYSNDAPVAGIDGWRYYEKTITGTSSVTISSGSAIYIDELRLYPVGAIMTTYTHKPGVGVTEVTDPNGVPMHYQYDNLGRLKATRDKDTRLIKTVDYHYKDQN